MGVVFVFKNADMFADKKQRASIRIRQSVALFYHLILTLISRIHSREDGSLCFIN